MQFKEVNPQDQRISLEDAVRKYHRGDMTVDEVYEVGEARLKEQYPDPLTFEEFLEQQRAEQQNKEEKLAGCLERLKSFF